MTDMGFLGISEGRSNSSEVVSTTSERDARAGVTALSLSARLSIPCANHRGQLRQIRKRTTAISHTHTTEWYDPFELLKTPANPRDWSKILVFQNGSIFAKYNTCNNKSTQFIYGCMAAYLKRPAFVPEEGNSLLWSIETLSVPWIVVVHTNSFSNGL